MIAKKYTDALRPGKRNIDVRLIVDEAHYSELIQRGILTAKVSIWIATANVKDLHFSASANPLFGRARGYQSLVSWLREKCKACLDIRILHAGKPSRAITSNPAWRALKQHQRACPRVHLKMIAVDGRLLYLGSANFTGAGLGAKAGTRRNFEMGIITEDPLLLDETQRLFDDIWLGRKCACCKLRQHCPAPLDDTTPAARLR